MKALISGASGFIASHLSERLLSLGYKVIPIPRELLYDKDKLEKFITKCKPDYIFALHSYGNMYHQKDEDMIIGANILGTYNLLQATKNIPYKAFINVSSSSVTLSHQTIYSATKLAGEALCKAFMDEYDKSIVSVQPFTVIGKGEQSEHLIPTLIRSCLLGEKMPFNPYPVHDFIDVRDIVKAMIEIAENIEKYKGKNIGIGTGKQYENGEVLKIVEKLTGRKANIEIRDDVKRGYDNTKWHADLNDFIIRNYSLEETIKWMI